MLGATWQAGKDAFGHPLLSGAAQYLVELVKKDLRLRARFDKPGDLQRMASNCISRPDRDEAYLVGQVGVKALLAGESDKMVTLVRQIAGHPPDFLSQGHPQGDAPTIHESYHCTTGLVELAKIANEQQLMPAEYLNADKTMVTQAFYDYALPLIGDPIVDHARLEKIRIQRDE